MCSLICTLEVCAIKKRCLYRKHVLCLVCRKQWVDLLPGLGTGYPVVGTGLPGFGCILFTADLGMFSMFGRTAPPHTKRARTKGAAKFCMPEIMGEWTRVWSKKGRLFEENWHLTHGRWWLKRSPVFSRKNRVCRPRWRVPHFFLNRATLRVNPTLILFSFS